MYDILAQGGFVMGIIIACSVLAVTVAIQRWSYYRRIEKEDALFMPELRQALAAGAAPPAGDGPLARLWTAISGERRGSGNGNAAEIVLDTENLRLERYLYILATVATIAPLLGLLGTVLGMIKTFHAAAVSGAGNHSLLAEGIAEALYNTAAGLCVTIFCVVSHNHHRARADRLLKLLETRAKEIAALLAGGGGKHGA
jgi:biopolymer transport protein ExbB